VGLFSRSIRPPDDIVPNPNDPADNPPATVGPPTATPGDPHGVTVDDTGTAGPPPPRVMASAWSGWPADWWPSAWGGHAQTLDQMQQHLGIRLRATLVGAARRIEAIAHPVEVERAVEPFAGLARRHRDKVTAVAQRVDEVARALE